MAKSTKKKTKVARSGKGKKRIKFTIAGEEGMDVFLAGTFNNWDITSKKMKFKDGAYSTTMLLSPGTYEYKFVLNGHWTIDPECPDWSANEHGSLNSVLTVK